MATPVEKQRAVVARRWRRMRRYRRAAARWKVWWQRGRARLALLREREAAQSGRLSAHFNVREFACKDGTPVPRVAVPALKRLCVNYLEPLRAKFGACSVTSGYRHHAYNARIGGASRSEHIYDDGPGSVAADVTFARGTPKDWAAYARTLRGVGGVGQYRSFVHVDSGTRRDWWG